MALKASTASDGRVVFLVEVDDSKVKSGLDRVKQTISDNSQSWGDSLEKFVGKQMDSLIAKVAKLGAAFGEFVVKFIAEGIDLAQSVEEIDGLIESTFGSEGASKLDKWSKTTVKQFGLSELAAKKYSSKMASYAKSIGVSIDDVYEKSISVAGLSADLASFTPGTTPDTAFDAIYNALMGKGTALNKTFAIDLSDSAMKALNPDFAKMSADEKFLARYEQLVQKMIEKGAKGNFASSSGVEQSKAQIASGAENIQIAAGKIFTPAIEEAYSSGATLMNAASELLFGRSVGSRDEITEQLAKREQQLATLNDYIEKEAQTIGKQFGLSEEFYKMQGYQGSYGEWVMASLRQNQPWAEGEERQRIDDTLNKYDEALKAINYAKTEINSLKSDLEYLDQLDAEASAAEAAAAEVAQAVAAGLASEEGAVKSEVDAIIGEINRLNGVRYGKGLYIPHASGLDYVPYDNYRASLHAGESVLTAQEAKVWRSMKYGISQPSGVNYDALGSTMRENVKAGGNVYLDGQAVGRVISARQADSYRAMERSGFQQ